MNTNNLFIYAWHLDDKTYDDNLSIRVYGLNENDESVCLHVNDFTPYVYLELPTDIEWDGFSSQLLGKTIDDLMGKL